MADAVLATAEFRRVLALPRREPHDLDALAAEMTEILSVKGGCPGVPEGAAGLCSVCKAPTRLRRVQALALLEVAAQQGGLLPIGVGEGKTLIFWLAAYVLNVTCALGLLPASLVRNAETARKTLTNHWPVPKGVRLLSYELLGRAQSAGVLEDPNFQPAAIICDEAHRLKNLRAACTRRVARYMAKRPSTIFVGMSGTVMRDSLYDFAHLAFWAKKAGAPLPMIPHELDDWASALDEPKPGAPGADLRQLDPGALLKFANEEELREDPRTAARLGFRRRLVETPGIVAAAGEGEDVGASIYVRAHAYTVKPVTEEHFHTLRSKWERPDGKLLEQGVDVWRHARELALGFHYEWDPPPPEPWVEARRRWSAYVRGVLSRSHTLDSPLTVINALDSGKRDDPQGRDLLASWRAVRDTFKPNTISVWHDESALAWCAKWMQGGGIVWTEHHFFAQRLARETGAPYYGPQGYTAKGEYIEDSKAPVIVASIDANRDGKNLQHQWCRNLITSPPDGWDWWQQTIARTHRPGQTADEVIVDFLLGCREHYSAWCKAMAGTEAARDTIGAKPKLLLADVEIPSVDEIARFQGARWR